MLKEYLIFPCQRLILQVKLNVYCHQYFPYIFDNMNAYISFFFLSFIQLKTIFFLLNLSFLFQGTEGRNFSQKISLTVSYFAMSKIFTTKNGFWNVIFTLQLVGNDNQACIKFYCSLYVSLINDASFSR
jgi:hypothetical protein